MQRTHTSGAGRAETKSDASSVERWLANSLATILAALAIGAGVIGVLVAFGYLNADNSQNHFNDGMVWLVVGLILAIAGNVFRREHPLKSGYTDDFGDTSGERYGRGDVGTEQSTRMGTGRTGQTTRTGGGA